MDENARRALIAELDKWRQEGVITSEQQETLRARYSTPIEPDGSETESESRGLAASAWFQLVGGLLLGAGLIALVVFLELQEPASGYVMMGLGVLALAAGYAAHQTAPERRGLSDAALAAGLVAVGVASPVASNSNPWVALLGAALGALVFAWRRGASPVAVAAAAVFVSGTFSFANSSLFTSDDASAFVAWGALLAFGAFMLVWRAEFWTNVALAPYVGAIAVSFFMVLDAVNVSGSEATELWLGAHFAILFGIGIYLGARGLAIGGAAGLTIDAVVFAFDVGGALTAVVLLLTLGGILVWQAELVRNYLRGPKGKAH